MKLIVHDILTELRHWRWLVVLWWALLFIDLGYQCEWWWDGPSYTDTGSRAWTAGDEMHGGISSFVSPFLWIGISASALFLFLSISPARTASSVLVQPMSSRSRILARFLWLSIFVGLPWYLHEWIYVRQMADASAALALLAVFERSLMTMNIWLGLAILGWCSGTIWNALKICVVGIASCFGMMTILEAIPLEEGLLDVLANPQIDLGIQWGNLVLVLVPAIGILVCYQLSFRSGISTLTRKWLPIVLCSVLAIPAQITTVKVIEAFAKQWATNDQWISEDLAEWKPEIDKSKSSLLPSPESVANPVWNLVSSYEGLPSTAFSRVVSVEGSLSSRDGTIKRKLEYTNRHIFPGEMENQSQWLRHLFQKFPDATVFTSGMPLPVDDGRMLVLSGYGGKNPGMPFDAPMDAKAELDLDLWEMGGAHLLPVEGETKDAGALRGAGVYSIARTSRGWTLYLRHFQNTSFLNLQKAIDPNRLFALWNPKTQQMILLVEHGYPRTISGSFSNLRLEEKELRVDDHGARLFGNDFVSEDFLTREWIEKSQLVIIEAKFAGSLNREIRADYESYTEMAPIPMQYRMLRPQQVEAQKLAKVWENPESSESEIRRAAYEHLSIQKDGQWNVSPAPNHIPVLRQLALEFPGLLSRFARVWREEDREWFLKDLETDEEPPAELVRFASTEGWLQNREGWLAGMIAKGKYPVSFSDLERAVELEIPGAAEMKFRRQLGGKDTPVDQTKFPEIWDAEKTRLWKVWKKREWRLQVASAFSVEGISLARMGEPEPLRKLLEAFLKIGKADWEKSFHSFFPYRSRWEWLSSAFDPAEIKDTDSPEKKAAAVERWLASEWVYQAETMNYRIVE